ALKIRADESSTDAKYSYLSSKKHCGPGPGTPIHIPLHDDQHIQTVRVTEGELKADVATSLSGVLTVAVPGVALWRRALPVLDALGARHILLAFDADWRRNPHVARALGQAAVALLAASYDVEIEQWDPTTGNGIDEVFASGQTPRLTSPTLALGALV